MEAHARSTIRRHALNLEYLTLTWNLVEGVVAVSLAIAAGSVALLAFGIDSFVESASATVLIWRLRAEVGATDRAAIERLDRRAHQLVGLSLILLALYIAIDAGMALWQREQPQPSPLGLVLTAVTMGTSMWLARAKRRAAAALKSRALAADAFQTTACWWLSGIALLGLGLNAAFGWWWADPIAALGMTVLLVREGREAWRGDDCC